LLDLPVVVFLAITVRRHSKEWIKQFQFIIDQYPEIMEVHRLTGDGADYQLKIVCSSIEDYDKLQQELIEKIEFNSMSSHVSLLELKSTTALPISS
jgi:DNA-binding Lrp family transcriptional regulator